MDTDEIRPPVMLSAMDALFWGVWDCTCCGDGCDCGCVELCPVGLAKHARFREWLRERGLGT